MDVKWYYLKRTNRDKIYKLDVSSIRDVISQSGSNTMYVIGDISDGAWAYGTNAIASQNINNLIIFRRAEDQGTILDNEDIQVVNTNQLVSITSKKACSVTVLSAYNRNFEGPTQYNANSNIITNKSLSALWYVIVMDS